MSFLFSPPPTTSLQSPFSSTFCPVPHISPSFNSSNLPSRRLHSPPSVSRPANIILSSNNPDPPRISNASSLSLRQQLKLVQTSRRSAPPPRTRTSFRRAKSSTTLSTSHNSDEDANLPPGKYQLVPPLVFIDGYNVIGRWPRLRKWRDRQQLERARLLLLRDVADFAAVRGWKCVVAFDAQGSTGEITPEEDNQGVRVVYTRGETADSFIEREVFRECEIGKRQIWAATSDILQGRVAGTKGAHVMSAGLFVQELKRAKNETREKLEATDEEALRGKMLISNVDETTRERLYELRDRLDGRQKRKKKEKRK